MLKSVDFLERCLEFQECQKKLVEKFPNFDHCYWAEWELNFLKMSKSQQNFEAGKVEFNFANEQKTKSKIWSLLDLHREERVLISPALLYKQKNLKEI